MSDMVSFRMEGMMGAILKMNSISRGYRAVRPCTNLKDVVEDVLIGRKFLEQEEHNT